MRRATYAAPDQEAAASATTSARLLQRPANQSVNHGRGLSARGRAPAPASRATPAAPGRRPVDDALAGLDAVHRHEPAVRAPGVTGRRSNASPSRCTNTIGRPPSSTSAVSGTATAFASVPVSDRTDTRCPTAIVAGGRVRRNTIGSVRVEHRGHDRATAGCRGRRASHRRGPSSRPESRTRAAPPAPPGRSRRHGPCQSPRAGQRGACSMAGSAVTCASVSSTGDRRAHLEPALVRRVAASVRARSSWASRLSAVVDAGARGALPPRGFLHTARGNSARGGQAFDACAFRLRRLELTRGPGSGIP